MHRPLCRQEQGCRAHRTSMMGCVALSSIVFFDAMYDDMVLSRSACGNRSQQGVSLGSMHPSLTQQT